MGDSCSNCMRLYNEDQGVIPADVPYDALCTDCYASRLADETVLSQREAEVYVLKQLNYTHNEIAAFFQEQEDNQDSPKKSTIDELSRRINQRVEAAKATVEHIDT